MGERPAFAASVSPQRLYAAIDLGLPIGEEALDLMQREIAARVELRFPARPVQLLVSITNVGGNALAGDVSSRAFAACERDHLEGHLGPPFCIQGAAENPR